MADKATTARAHARPLSPHLQIYRWPITMATSILHRGTGIALSVGSVILAWWLVALATGPDAYATFVALAATPLGQLILFGIVLSLCFHLLNGIRHLMWDIGYGFDVGTASVASFLIIAASIVLAVAIFACVYAQMGVL